MNSASLQLSSAAYKVGEASQKVSSASLKINLAKSLNFIQKIVEMSQIYHNFMTGNCFHLNQGLEAKEHQTGRRNWVLKYYFSIVQFICVLAKISHYLRFSWEKLLKTETNILYPDELLAGLVEYSTENNGFCSKNEMLPGGGVHLPGGADRLQGALWPGQGALLPGSRTSICRWNIGWHLQSYSTTSSCHPHEEIICPCHCKGKLFSM